MPQADDLIKSLTPIVQSKTLIAVIELSLSSWLVAGVIPGVARQPLKTREPDEAELLRLLQRWRDDALKSGYTIERVVVAYEAGRDGFWLTRWLRAHEIEVRRCLPRTPARAKTAPMSRSAANGCVFRKVIKAIKSQASTPGTITLDDYAASHPAVREMKTEAELPAGTKVR